jgi:hypothetical protein
MTAPNGATRKTGALGWVVTGIERDYTMWQSGKFRALSSLVNIDDGHQQPHYEWVVSFSQQDRQTVSDKDIARCLRDFDALDFEEDNHEPGIARKFFLPVEHQYRKPCPCKDERLIALGEFIYSTTEKE